MRREDLRRAPYLTWNAFVDLLTASAYEQLGPTQRPAYLAFSYDSTVSNGGHLRYFEMHGLARHDATLAALDSLGARGQWAVLDDAARAWRSRSTAEDVPQRAVLMQRLDELDRRYHACHPEIPELLQAHLEEHLTEFIELVD